MQFAYLLLSLLPLLAAAQDAQSLVNNAQDVAASVINDAGGDASAAGAQLTSTYTILLLFRLRLPHVRRELHSRRY